MPARDTYVKTASGWEQIATTIQAVPQGLVPIVPTSVTGGSVTGSGVVSFSAATSLGIDGVFSSAYDSYRIIFNATGSATLASYIRMRSAGTNTATTNYLRSGYIAYAANTGSGNYNATNDPGFLVGYSTSSVGTDCVIDLIDPGKAAVTRAHFSVNGSDGNYFGINGSSTHPVATAYDGFGITLSSGNITGTIQIYGYSKGGLTQPQTIQPYSQAAGSINLNGNSTRTRSGTITFPVGRFSVNPLVTLGSGEGNLHASVTSITTTGATITLTHLDATNWNATYPAYWQATQMTSSSAGG